METCSATHWRTPKQHASGAGDDFRKMHAKLKANSKRSNNGSMFGAGYPFKQPSTTMQGHAKGTFSDLEFIVAIAIDPNGSNDCLTRTNGGLFHWSEATTNKIGDGATEDKRLKLVLCMLTLFINLMLDLDDNLSHGSFFEEFMTDYNLYVKNRS